MAEGPWIWTFLGVTQGLGTFPCPNRSFFILPLWRCMLPYPYSTIWLLGNLEQRFPLQSIMSIANINIYIARCKKQTNEPLAGCLCKPSTLIRKLRTKTIRTKFSVWPFNASTTCPSLLFLHYYLSLPLYLTRSYLLQSTDFQIVILKEGCRI